MAEAATSTMAKRSRGTARPGQLRPTRRTQRPTGGAASAAATEALRPATLRPDVDDTSAADVARDVPNPDRAVARGRRTAEVAAPARYRSPQGSSLLAARAAEEYGYVVRDVRRIGVVGGGIVAVLAILFVLIDVLKLVTL